MDKFLQILISFSMFVGGIAAIIRQSASVLFLDKEIQPIRARFDGWWQTAAALPPRLLTLEMIRKIDVKINSFFGIALFSRRAFMRSGSIGLSLLGCALLILNVVGKPSSLFIPWKQYHDCMKILQSPPKFDLSNNQAKKDTEFFDKLADIAEQSDTVPAAVIFSVIFYLVLSATGAAGFSFSLLIFRRLIRALSRTDDWFLAVAAFVLAFVLTALLTTVSMLVIGTIGTPALWMFGVIGMILSMISWKVAVFVLVLTAVLTWIFAGPTLIVLAMVIFSPLLCAIGITLWSAAALSVPSIFHRVTVRILLLCKQKNPVVTLASLIGLAALILVILLKSFQWILHSIYRL